VTSNPPPDRGIRAPARFGHLQQLRAIAALMVVLYHARFPHYPTWSGHGFGTLGVDLFFVISGFVIYWVTRHETSFRRFLLRRIVRVVPLYWMLTVLMAATVLLAPRLFKQTVFDLVHFVQSLAFVPAFNPSRPDEIQPLLTPGWTLSYEIFFYLAFGLAFFLFAKLPSRLSLFTGLFLALVIAGAVFAPENPVLLTFTSPRLLEFLAGIWIGVWINRGTAVPGKRWALTFLLAGWLCLLFEPLLFGWGALLGAGMVVLGAVSLERVWRIKNRTMEFLGDASYSIYLTQVLTLGALRQGWLRVQALNGMPLEPAAFMLVGTVLCACVGSLTYLAVERPMLQILNKTVNRQNPSRE
jgi:exopolysaccharide production protein ExoZ